MKITATLVHALAMSSNTQSKQQQQLQLQQQELPTPVQTLKRAFVLPSLLGLTLVSQVASATPLVDMPTTTVAIEKLDMSMPSYSATTMGFGEGTEAYLNKQRDTEDELQAITMRKAEEARQARLAAKKAEFKAREEEQKAAAAAKKKRDAAKARAFLSGDLDVQ